ncbi:MAG: nucleotidyl transferase AbiEii/AbiGii toxin family protein [Bryobacterales bacterium]|nr:nucleotidyl transferase AbiEii/AbiGii toxin family protein [Bryobacterales bacterium]
MSFIDQAHLAARVLPYIRRQPDFALKGGTAINLFFRDLPRYSVDIDLIFLPIGSYSEDLESMRNGLEWIANEIRKEKPSNSQIVAPGRASRHPPRIQFRHRNASIKMEVSPVSRGTVWPSGVKKRRIKEAAENEFGFLESRVASFEDVYAGKICAALDRQHPRDLFDVKELLTHEGVDRKLVKTFLVYLISSKRLIPDLLAPQRIDISEQYESDLKEMVRVPTSEEELIAARERLLHEIHTKMTQDDRDFLMSVQQRKPDWSLIDIPRVDRLPGVRRRIENLDGIRKQDYDDSVRRLDTILNDQDFGGP